MKSLACSVAIKITNPSFDSGDITEVAIVPLLNDFLLDPTTLPFSLRIKATDTLLRVTPKNAPRHILTSTGAYEVSRVQGIDAGDAASRLQKWFEKLNIETLSPMGFSYGSMMPFLIKWLGAYTYASIFSWFYRDPMSVFLYGYDFNAKDFKPERRGEPSITKAFELAKLNITHESDCMTIAVETARFYQANLVTLLH